MPPTSKQFNQKRVVLTFDDEGKPARFGQEITLDRDHRVVFDVQTKRPIEIQFHGNHFLGSPGDPLTRGHLVSQAQLGCTNCRALGLFTP